MLIKFNLFILFIQKPTPEPTEGQKLVLAGVDIL